MIAVRRAESDADYEAWRAIRMAVHPDELALDVDAMRARDTPERLLVLAESAGEIVGCGLAEPSHAGDRVVVAPRVRPEARGHGVGTELLRVLLAHARTLGIETLTAHVDANDEGSVAFARRYGFEEVDRQVEQVKRLGEEPAPEFPRGIEVVTLADRPELLREAYPLAANEGYADMAVPWQASITLEEWVREEGTYPAGSFVALSNGEIVGYSGLVRDADDASRAEDGLTVVRRDWRRRGLATALKRAELAWAAANGLREVYTWTQRGNEGMRKVNERLGYEYRHVELTLRAERADVETTLALRT